MKKNIWLLVGHKANGSTILSAYETEAMAVAARLIWEMAKVDGSAAAAEYIELELMKTELYLTELNQWER